MRKIVLTFGLLGGAVMSAMMLLTLPFADRIGFDKGAIIGYTSMVLAFLMVWFGIRAWRDTVGGGVVGFGRAFAVGLLITMVASACYVATWQLVYYKLAPDITDKYMAHALEKARAKGATQAQLEAQRKQFAEYVELYRNPLVNAAITFLEPLPVGLVFTLVSAGILSRRRKASPA